MKTIQNLTDSKFIFLAKSLLEKNTENFQLYSVSYQKAGLKITQINLKFVPTYRNPYFREVREKTGYRKKS